MEKAKKPVLASKKLCTGCGACAAACSVNAIKPEPDSEGFLYPVPDSSLCVGCGRCSSACPVLSPLTPTPTTMTFAAYASDKKTVSSSSSGGMFTLLAEYVLARGGEVFGAAFDSRFKVKTVGIDNEADLSLLRGSKYVQSDTADSMRAARTALEAGRYVLYSGTPCQVSGFSAMLGKKYDKLITVDIICHSVPSPAVWQAYLEYRRKAAGSDINDVIFRSKTEDWRKSHFKIGFTDGSVYDVPGGEDPYLRAFIGGIISRVSCEHCLFKGSARVSDFTVADLWGAEQLCPEFMNYEGTSLIMLHGSKASEIWNCINKNMSYRDIDYNSAFEYNTAAFKRLRAGHGRKKFFSKYSDTDFTELTELCLKPDFSARMYSRLSESLPVRILRRVKRGIFPEKR